MKSRLFQAIILSLCCLSFTAAKAQTGEPLRTFIHVHGNRPLTFWSSQIDSITFLDETLDLACDLSVSTDIKDVGKAVIKAKWGKDAVSVKFFLKESFYLNSKDGMDDGQLMSILSAPITKTIGLNEQYDATGLQRNENYSLVMAAVDKYGFLGKPARIDFTTPKYPMAGNPNVEVETYDITQTSITMDIKPNDDCKGYYSLFGNIDPRTFRGMTLRQYIVAWGGKMPTREPHVDNTIGMKFTSLMPSTTYPIYVVLVDKNGMLSDVIKKEVTTEMKGTEQEAKCSIEVSDITSTKAHVVVTPDENTSVFKVIISLKDKYDNDAETKDYIDKMFDAQNEYQFPWLSKTDDHTWENLTPGTEYYVLAKAKNGKGEWGPLVKFTFKTLAAKTKAYTNRPSVNVIGRAKESFNSNTPTLSVN